MTVIDLIDPYYKCRDDFMPCDECPLSKGKLCSLMHDLVKEYEKQYEDEE